MNLIYWLAGGAVAVSVVGMVLYWLLVTTEGVYLGRRIVIWLYDVTAHKYDAIKEYDPQDEYLLVTMPVLDAVRGMERPILLDVATGTGRVPYDLMQTPAFSGRLIGLDDSAGMIAIARQKLQPFGDRVALVRQPATPLPFPEDTFDAVTCLEALEFFPSDEAALREMVRVLRPGSMLLVTRRCGWEAALFLFRYRSEKNMRALLQSLGLEEIRFFSWQVNYDLVIARKPLL